MASALDVAAYILEKVQVTTAMKLQKLVYYSQAWSLVWDESPLFSEPIEAWMDGPVVPQLFQHHRGRFEVRAGEIPGDPAELTHSQRETIDKVIEAYGGLTGTQLSKLTHDEGPWVEARAGLAVDDPCKHVIPLDSIQSFYTAMYNSLA